MIIQGDDFCRFRWYDRHSEIRTALRRAYIRPGGALFVGGVGLDRAEKWLQEEGLTLLEGWARDGATREAIAQQMGVSASTFYRWIKRYPQLAQALRKGREVVDYQVEQALLDRALGGDLRAQMYWLNNRRGDKWQEHPKEKTEQTEEEGVTVIVDV